MLFINGIVSFVDEDIFTLQIFIIIFFIFLILLIIFKNIKGFVKSKKERI